jgi:uncharacterized membrane protein
VPAADPEFDSHATDRLTLFSDAVVAIAITLLAIELPVPSSGTSAAFLTSVKDDSGGSWALMAAFGLSIPVFFVTSCAWVLWIAVPVAESFWFRHRRGDADIGGERRWMQPLPVTDPDHEVVGPAPGVPPH